ncbi:kinase-like domain-containing protein [Flagelloscypha sp. PMI_526]|nr:kinase-like domain-containing protein [Flagelloscypha sp. PMI_526]
MEYQTLLGEDDPPPRYVPREDADNSNSSSILVVQPGTFEFTIPFQRDREIDQGTSLSEDFDPFKHSHASQLRASMISCLWPYNGSRALGSQVGMGDIALAGTSLSSGYFHEQYSNSETQTKTTLLDEISLRLQAKHSSPSAPDIKDALWLKTSIRSLFDTTNPRSSFLDELNTRHPDVHFEGTSFTDSTHEILSSVMVSSGINAQIIFLKDVELTNLIPFDSSGIRAWIIDLSGEIPSSVNEATKALSKDEASCLLVLLEFVLHCECGILLRQHRRKAMRLIQKIAAEHHTLPPTLELKAVEPAKHPFGGGGYSDVYKASWHGTSICVKRLRIYLDPESGSAGARKDKVLQAFLKEALIWKQLRHPNILPFLGISSTCFPHQMSLISPYMANGDIMSYLETVSGTNAPTYTQRLGWVQFLTYSSFVCHIYTQVVALALGVARGMQYIHSMSLYHGDIKGANILIDDNDVARLADLGISSVAWSSN